MISISARAAGFARELATRNDCVRACGLSPDQARRLGLGDGAAAVGIIGQDVQAIVQSQQSPSQGTVVRQVKAQNLSAQRSAAVSIGTGAAAGALAGAAAGSVVPVIGTVIGAAVGAIAGSIPGIIAFANAHGTSHSQRMAEWNDALNTAVQSADLKDAAPDLQAAQAELEAFQSMLGSAQSSTDAGIQAALTAATTANQALATAGDALAADVKAYEAGADQINAWNVNTPAQLALERIPAERQALVAATASAHAANAALQAAHQSAGVEMVAGDPNAALPAPAPPVAHYVVAGIGGLGALGVLAAVAKAHAAKAVLSNNRASGRRGRPERLRSPRRYFVLTRRAA